MYSAIVLVLFSFQATDATSKELALLKTFREEFVKVTPGKGRYPKHDTLQEFWIAKYEVPQNLWASVMAANPSRWKGPRNSVERMSFPEAQAFCKKATQQMRAAKLISEKQEVRLPFEDEWEYAARAGTKTAYSFGDDVEQLDEYAWSTRNAAGNDPAVGALKPNPWGLYDVHGYLREWCLIRPDDATATKRQAKPDPNDMKKSGKEKRRKLAVVRGGSWKDTADKLESSARLLINQTDRDDAVGFRCVLARVESEKSPKSPESD